ncbi:pantoate--beta-alanine ligase [Methylocapsa sp. D3K7]|uniref:pantoate--beta-alanine ligase n=1 Tax=Methylocapsa sp. D3K7 TaxID=3041435 RepID=UPI00244EECD5|nr:pantoate--beta-alanine ligase [Methylocapsa sp. D3K7]WGJ14092.1 pantoate--beta-alanine ligase [Methylocapsa sp. D3K7]
MAAGTSPFEIAHDVTSLRVRLAEWRREGETIGLVPTMGALHAGHMSLVDEAKKHARRIVLSIFVNPTQFAPSEDFSAYPRTLDADVEKFAAAGGDLVFAPVQAHIYPPGFATTLSMRGPATAGLEDRCRPTHFAGVATIIAKLFNLCRPDAAIFGEKDYQQLKVVQRMARDLDFETRVIGVPTMRERDGLALSSRNVYLSAKERAAAPALYAALARCAREIKEGVAIETALETARKEVTAAGFAIDYIEARHADTLAPIASREAGPVRLLAAAALGKTRLIDNIGL